MSRKTARTGNKTETREQKKKEESRVLFHAALFHSGTPLVARSTAEAASQSPLLVCPVTLHHWGQRALCLPINEPASALVPPLHSPSSHNSVGDRIEAAGKGKSLQEHLLTRASPPAALLILQRRSAAECLFSFFKT